MTMKFSWILRNRRLDRKQWGILALVVYGSLVPTLSLGLCLALVFPITDPFYLSIVTVLFLLSLIIPIASLMVGRSLSLAIVSVQQREHEQSATITLSKALRCARNRAEMFPIILDHICTLLHSDSAALVLYDSYTNDMVLESACGAWADATGQRFPACNSPGAGIETEQLINTSISALLSQSGQPTNPEHEKGILLVAQNRVIGILWVGRQSTAQAPSRSPFTPGDVRILSAIGDIAASALHRATLHEQTLQRMQCLSVLHTVDMAITASRDIHLVLSVLLDQLINHLHVDAAAVWSFNPYTRLLNCVASRGIYAQQLTALPFRPGEGYAGRALAERRIVYVPHLSVGESIGQRDACLSSEGFDAYYGVPLIARGQIKGELEIFHRSALDANAEWMEFLETLAGQTALAIDNAELFASLQRSHTDIMHAYDATLEGWSRMLDMRDNETEGHSQRVTEMSLRLARAMGLPAESLVHIRRGALLHDIGKMGIPDTILLKPGPLNEEEWRIMRRHPVYAYDILYPISFLHPALDIPYCHHEKWDGTGYPRALRGEQIPVAARIFAVVDVWDALRSDRPYRKAWPEGDVRSYLRAQAGKHFDPAIVVTFLQLLEHQDNPLRQPEVTIDMYQVGGER